MKHPPHTRKVVHAHLLELQAERTLASIEGLAADSACMADLDGDSIGEPDIPAGLTISEYRRSRPRRKGGRGRPHARSPSEDRRPALPVNPLALDPYSPTSTTRGPEWNEADPLALDPYSPLSIVPFL